MFSQSIPGIASLRSLLKRLATIALSCIALMTSTVSHASMAEFDLCSYWTDVPDAITFKRALNPFLGLSETIRTERNHSGVTTNYFKNQEGNVAGGPLHARNCTYGSNTTPGNSRMILNFKFKGTNFFGKPAGIVGVGNHFAVLSRGFVNREPNTVSFETGRGFAIFPPVGSTPSGSKTVYIERFSYEVVQANNMNLVVEDDKWYRVEMWNYQNVMHYTIYDEAFLPNIYMNGSYYDPQPLLADVGYGFAAICTDLSCETVADFELQIKDISYGWAY